MRPEPPRTGVFHVQGTPHTAQTIFPVASATSYQPHRWLMASTSTNPRPLSVSSDGSMRSGGLGLASPTRIRTSRLFQVSHSLTGHGQPSSAADASMAFVTSSLVISSTLRVIHVRRLFGNKMRLIQLQVSVS